jgi:hypothetical protein
MREKVHQRKGTYQTLADVSLTPEKTTFPSKKGASVNPQIATSGISIFYPEERRGGIYTTMHRRGGMDVVEDQDQVTFK